MDSRLESAWQDAVAAHRSFTERLRALAPQHLAASESEGSWTPLQVAEHLLFAETGTLSYLRKKTRGGWEALPPSDEEGARRSQALQDALNQDQRLKAPEVLPEPQGEIPLAELLERWEGVRAKMQRFVEELDERFLDRQVFRHAVAGRMDLFQTLSFLTEHLHHHRAQLDRIEAAAGVSEAGSS